MEKRTCKICSYSFKVEEFPLARTIKGKKYYRHICNKCYVESKKPRKMKIRKWLIDYKKTLKCEECDNNDYRVLEFHHNGDKDFNISDATRRGFSIEKIEEEIKKCSVLCANCHRIEHYDGVWESW